jgi:hypothetical protein
MAEWLWRWLESRVSLRASTSRSCTAHMQGYLVQYPGGIPLATLSPAAHLGLNLAATITGLRPDSANLLGFASGCGTLGRAPLRKNAHTPASGVARDKTDARRH